MVAFQLLPDHVEALIALDQADRAVPLIDWLDERGRAVGRTWPIADSGLVCLPRSASQTAVDEHDHARPLSRSPRCDPPPGPARRANR